MFYCTGVVGDSDGPRSQPILAVVVSHFSIAH